MSVGGRKWGEGGGDWGGSSAPPTPLPVPLEEECLWSREDVVQAGRRGRSHGSLELSLPVASGDHSGPSFPLPCPQVQAPSPTWGFGSLVCLRQSHPDSGREAPFGGSCPNRNGVPF